MVGQLIVHLFWWHPIANLVTLSFRYYQPAAHFRPHALAHPPMKRLESFNTGIHAYVRFRPVPVRDQEHENFFGASSTTRVIVNSLVIIMTSLSGLSVEYFMIGLKLTLLQFNPRQSLYIIHRPQTFHANVENRDVKVPCTE